jgi:hypothetical protein
MKKQILYSLMAGLLMTVCMTSCMMAKGPDKPATASCQVIETPSFDVVCLDTCVIDFTSQVFVVTNDAGKSLHDVHSFSPAAISQTVLAPERYALPVAHYNLTARRSGSYYFLMGLQWQPSIQYQA